MRVTLEKLLEKLGVDGEMHPYEVHPWFFYDSEKKTSCAAEVRMGPWGKRIEAEVTVIKDPDPALVPEDDPWEEKEDEIYYDDGTYRPDEGTDVPHLRKQMIFMIGEPVNSHGDWTIKKLVVKGEDYGGQLNDWEQKGCDLFATCIQSILMGELPDLDDLIKKQIEDEKKKGENQGRGSRKSQKIKPAQFMNINKRGI